MCSLSALALGHAQVQKPDLAWELQSLAALSHIWKPQANSEDSVKSPLIDPKYIGQVYSQQHGQAADQPLHPTGRKQSDSSHTHGPSTVPQITLGCIVTDQLPPADPTHILVRARGGFTP